MFKICNSSRYCGGTLTCSHRSTSPSEVVRWVTIRAIKQSVIWKSNAELKSEVFPPFPALDCLSNSGWLSTTRSEPTGIIGDFASTIDRFFVKEIRNKQIRKYNKYNGQLDTLCLSCIWNCLYLCKNNVILYNVLFLILAGLAVLKLEGFQSKLIHLSVSEKY